MSTPSEANAGEGWFEWHKMPGNTTHIGYVYESGNIYLPEPDVTRADFLLASAERRVHRLVRADDLQPTTITDAEVSAAWITWKQHKGTEMEKVRAMLTAARTVRHG